LPNFALKGAAPYTWRIDSYEKWIKEETRLDSRSRPRIEVARPKEDACGQNRQVSEAH
jgi:hypothetical protein